MSGMILETWQFIVVALAGWLNRQQQDIVDNRTFRRLAYRVLEHDPSQEDIREFFGQFKAHLDAHGLKVLGITTDGSPRYPPAIQEVFPEARHQVCQFRVLKELIQAVLHAVARGTQSPAACFAARPTLEGPANPGTQGQTNSAADWRRQAEEAI